MPAVNQTSSCPAVAVDHSVGGLVARLAVSPETFRVNPSSRVATPDRPNLAAASGRRRRRSHFTLLSLALVLFAIALSVLSAADADLLPRVRRLLAANDPTSGTLTFDPAKGPQRLAAVAAGSNFMTFDADLTIGEGSSYPNLLQTAPGNAGLRIESDGKTIAAVVADPKQANGYVGVTLARDLVVGQRYRIKLDYVAGSSSNIAIREGDGAWAHFSFLVNAIDLSAPMFGGGFAPERRWTGTAYLRSVRSGTLLSVARAEMILGLTWALGSALLIGAMVRLWAPLAMRRAEAAFSGLDLFRTKPDIGAGEAGDYLSVFRVLAFLAVALGHGVLIFFKPDGLAETLRATPGLALFIGSPWAGVWMFFVLSGYLMGKGFWAFRYSLNGDGLLAFLNNRLVKILPAYLAALLFFGLLHQPEAILKENAFVLFRLLTFNCVGPFDYRPIGALWSISTEFQFYMIAPVLTLLVLRATQTLKTFALTLAGLAGMGLALRYGLYIGAGMGAWIAYIYTPLYANLDLFCFGIAAAGLSRFLPRITAGRRVVVLAGIALMVGTYAAAAAFCANGAVFSPLDAPHNPIIWAGPTTIGLLSMATIAVIELGYACGGSRMPKTIARGVALAGALTYPLYLWHEPVFGAFTRVLAVKGNLIAVLPGVLACIAITAVFAYFTYVAIELPAAKWRRSGPWRIARPPA